MGLKEKAVQYLLPVFMQQLFSLVEPEHLRSAIDSFLDKVEESIKDSTNKVDDAIVLPLINLIRSTFSINDIDEK